MRRAFAKALRTTRKNRKLTQEDLAAVSSRTYLSSLERGRQSPTLDKIALLAGALGIHPLTLLTLACLYFDRRHGIEALLARVRSEIELRELEKSVIRLLITDDHAIMRDGLKQLFALVDDIKVAGEASDGEESLALLADGGIDMLLLDMTMPGLSGKDLISAVRARHPQLPVLVLSMHVEPQIVRDAIEAGANGYLSKDQDAETLLAAVRAVAGGRPYLDAALAERLNFGFR